MLRNFFEDCFYHQVFIPRIFYTLYYFVGDTHSVRELIQKRDGIFYSRCPGSHKKNAERKRIIINVIRKLNIQHTTQSQKYNQCMVNIVELTKASIKLRGKSFVLCTCVDINVNDINIKL